MRSLNKNNGFTLIEVIVVMTILGILSKIGTPSFIHTVRRVEAGAAKHTLSNIYKECYMNTQLDGMAKFKVPRIRGYRITPSSGLNCKVKLVQAISTDLKFRPNYFLDLNSGLIGCQQSTGKRKFPGCTKLSANNSVIASNTGGSVGSSGSSGSGGGGTVLKGGTRLTGGTSITGGKRLGQGSNLGSGSVIGAGSSIGGQKFNSQTSASGSGSGGASGGGGGGISSTSSGGSGVAGAVQGTGQSSLPPNTSVKFGPNSGLSCREVKSYDLGFSGGYSYITRRNQYVPITPKKITAKGQSWIVKGASQVLAPWQSSPGCCPRIHRGDYVKKFAVSAVNAINNSGGNFSAEVDPNDPTFIKIYSPKGTLQNDISVSSIPRRPGSIHGFASVGISVNDKNKGKTTTVCDGK